MLPARRATVSLLAVLAALAGLAAGCGTSPGGGEPDSAGGRGGHTALPAVTVQDLEGGRVRLDSLAAAGRPVLLWIWGPF
jgi:hypothetical protein